MTTNEMLEKDRLMLDKMFDVDIKIIAPTKEERIQEAIDSIKLMSPDAYAAIYNKGRNDAIDECINQIPFLATDGEFNRCARFVLYRLKQLKEGK